MNDSSMRRGVFLGAVALAAVVTLIFGIDALDKGLVTLGIFDLSVSLTSLGILWWAYRKPDSMVPRRIFVAVMSSFFVYLFASGGHGGTGLLFLLLLPVATPLFLGWRHGVAISLVTLLACIVLAIVGSTTSPFPGIPEDTLLARVGAIYVVSLVLSSLYDSAMERAYREEIRAKEALRESERFLQDMFDSIQDGISVLDTDFNIVGANEWMERLYTHQGPLTGKKCYEAYQQRQSSCPWCPVVRTIETGERQTEVVPYPTADAPAGWIELTSFPIKDDSGRVVSVIEHSKDISDRKRAEAALELQRAHIQQLFDNSPDAIVRLDPEDRVVRANRGFEEFFGYTSREIEGRLMNELVVPAGYEEEAKALTRTVLDGGVVRKETVRRRKDGKLVDASIVGYPIMVDDRMVGTYVMYVDITKRKKMEEEIRQAAEEWRETFDSIGDAVSIHGPDCRVLRANRAFAEMFKADSGGALEGHCYEKMHGTEEPVPGCPHQETLRTGCVARAEFFEPHLGIHLEVTTSPIFDERGEITSTVHIARDITERRRQEDHLMMAERLVSIGELAAGTAHELNNPLTSVIGFSGLLLEKEVPEDIREDLSIINKEAQRAGEVVKELLDFASKRSPVKQPSQINTIIEDVLRLRRYEHRANKIKVRRDLAADLPEVMVDYSQMQQVLLNIIINAEQAISQAKNGGTLGISTERRNSTVVVSVSDDGPGIPQEHVDKVFNHFFTTKKPGEGTGLGLSICRRIVTDHSGEIYAESQPGEGATFSVELPVNGACYNEDVI